ncbi:sporulation inhibitor of replication protein SirA [Bacillus songklensis]
MRKYDIYLIEDEFAIHYFQKEDIMYQLFLEYKTSGKDHDIYVKKQIEYITKKIPILQLQLMIENKLGHSHGLISFSSGEYGFKTENGLARLLLKHEYIYMEAEGTVEAEAGFFEVLRKISPCFLAMNFENHVYGWLNPVKQRKICIK